MLPTLSNRDCQWIRGGADGDVILSTRVRLARNIAGYPFLSRASGREVARIEELMRGKITGADIAEDLEYYRIDEMGAVERQVLVERHLIGQEHADRHGPGGVAFTRDETLSIMVNEEDHLRVQIMGPGMDLRRAFERVREIDQALAEVIPFAFSAKFGYLTACPTNVGTGLRASVLVHLPALSMAREMDRIVGLCQDRDLSLRGLYGEGSQASADLYELSNQVTLGKKEMEIVSGVKSAVQEIAGRERDARDLFMEKDHDKLGGRVGRALELLQSAGELSVEESLNFLSQVRLGVECGLLREVDGELVNRLLLLTLPAHLQTMEGEEIERLERNRLRARYLKDELLN